MGHSTWPESSVALINTIFRIAVIDTFLRMDCVCVASSVKLLYLEILYRFIGAGKIFFSVFSIASSVTKILANKFVSLYSIFFLKIVHWYRFNRYIFEYRCPPMGMTTSCSGTRLTTVGSVCCDCPFI